MPINYDASQSLIGAFQRGSDEAQAQAEIQRRQQQQVIDNEVRQKQIDEQRRQFEEAQRRDAEHFDATNKLNQAHFKMDQMLAALNLSKNTEETGNAAPGFTPDENQPSNDTIEVAPGEFAPRSTKYTNKDLGMSYEALGPAAAAERDATRKAVLMKPEEDARMREYVFQSNLNRQNDEASKANTLTNEQVMNHIENAQQIARDEMGYRHELQIHQMSLDAAKDKVTAKQATELWTQHPIDPESAKQLNVPPGSTWADVLGDTVSIPDKAKEKIVVYNKLENNLTQVQQDLSAPVKDASGNPIKDNKGNILTGYDLFFIGGLKGTIADLTKNMTKQSPLVNELRPKLANIFLDMKNEANLGSALTKNEADFLKGYVAGNERTLQPDTARHIIDNLIPTVRQNRLETITTYGKVKPGTSTQGQWSIVP